MIFGFLVVVGVYLGLAAGWVFLCCGFRKPGLRGVVGKLAIQASGLAAAYGVVTEGVVSALFGGSFPPFILYLLPAFESIDALATEIARRVWPLVGTVLLVTLLKPSLRVWSPGITLGTALIAAIVTGEWASREAMCTAAEKHGITTFERNSFRWSLSDINEIRS